MPNMDILEIRSKIVKANKLQSQVINLLIEINAAILEEFQKQRGFDAGNGCKIPPLQTTNKPIVREDPPCCGG